MTVAISAGPSLNDPKLGRLRNDGNTRLEQYVYNDKIVRLFALATLVWSIVAMLVGIIVATELAYPKLNMGIPYITFGRLRPLHTNAAIFAFAGNAFFAGIYYSTQRLCKARMWSDTLGYLHFWGWQLIIVSAALTLPFGITLGKEYAELEWPIKIAIAVVWAGFFAPNFFMTLVKRRERHLYVALWFYIATIITVAILHIFNGLALPVSFLKSYPIYAGVQDAFMQWWYGHNAVAFFLTTPFLGMMYYFVPKAADRPVYSYRLSIVHFWSLVFIYIWAGPHHLHYTALPEWASSLGMIFSLMLWMPSWGGMINGLLTLRGAWHKVASDPVLKFFVVAITFYGMATFEGPLLSIKSVNAVSHYTDWGIAHVHGGGLGWVGFMSFGMLYWLLPRLFQTKLWSNKLAELHFWVATIGILLYVVAIYVAGLTQGLMLRAIDDSGHLTYPDWIETVMAVIPMYWVRVVGGSMYLLGALFCAVNFFMTWRSRPATYTETVHTAPALDPAYASPPEPANPLANEHTVAEIGKKFDQWLRLFWHRRWESKPMLFTFWTLIAVVVASLFEIIPTFLISSNVPTIASVQPYTPLEIAGRDIYVSEGCYLCHSQMVRPILAETKRFGEYSKPGEFIYDHPFQWGSRRIGPDLQREGGKQSDLWHILHFENPPQVTPHSIMPPYPWLRTEKIDFDGIPVRVAAMKTLGAPYKPEEVANAESLARAQAKEISDLIVKQGGPSGLEDRQVIALIAYIQRLGTDLHKAPPPPPTTAPVALVPPATPVAQGGQP